MSNHDIYEMAAQNNDVDRNFDGFTIDLLNSMEYIIDENWDVENPNREFNCEYINEDYNLNAINQFNVMSYNIRSFNANWDNFNSELVQVYSKCGIIGLCETRLTDATENLYSIDGYELFTRNVAADMGGVCLFVRKSLGCKMRDDLSIIKNHIEAIFIECVINKKNFRDRNVISPTRYLS